MINGVKGENRLARHICIIAERARHVKGGLAGRLLDYILKLASGQIESKSEILDKHEIAIFKDGVIL